MTRVVLADTQGVGVRATRSTSPTASPSSKHAHLGVGCAPNMVQPSRKSSVDWRRRRNGTGSQY